MGKKFSTASVDVTDKDCPKYKGRYVSNFSNLELQLVVAELMRKNVILKRLLKQQQSESINRLFGTQGRLREMETDNLLKRLTNN